MRDCRLLGFDFLILTFFGAGGYCFSNRLQLFSRMQIFKKRRSPGLCRPGSWLTNRNLLKLILLICCLSLATSAVADAGFSIRRRHAACIISFSGTGNLKTYKLVNAYRNGTINDEETIYVQEGGKRWEESDRDIKLLLVDTVTGKATDSLQFHAKDYSLRIKISGEQNGKLQYSMDSTKAVYDYLLLNDDEKSEQFSRNRILFITCSAAGFILLLLLFFFRKRKAEDQNPA